MNEPEGQTFDKEHKKKIERTKSKQKTTPISAKTQWGTPRGEMK
jgi:hypothetical protein